MSRVRGQPRPAEGVSPPEPEAEGIRAVLREIRQKFWRAWTYGLAFFSVSHLMIFMLPIWWLQPLLDNLACLTFNTYLALLSHEDAQDADGRAAAPRARHEPGEPLRIHTAATAATPPTPSEQGADGEELNGERGTERVGARG